MTYQGSLSDALSAIINGLRSVLRPKILLALILMILSIFLVVYVGIQYMLGLGLQQPGGVYAVQYPAYTIVSALVLVLLLFFLFFFFLDIALEVRTSAVPKNRGSLFLIALYKYPKFLIATIFQIFLTFGGLFLLIVPGVYLGVKSMFFNIETHTRNTSLMSGLKESFRLTSHDFWKPFVVFVFYLALFAILIYVFLVALTLGRLFSTLAAGAIISFCFVTYTLSTAALYFNTRRSFNSDKITSPVFRRVLQSS